MIKKFANPYIIFYPVISDDGMPFPVNKYLEAIQGGQSNWRGDLIVLKYTDIHYSGLSTISMADFPILKNYLMTHDPDNSCQGMLSSITR